MTSDTNGSGVIDGRSGLDNRLVDYPRLDLEIHNTHGGGLKDMSESCLTRSQRHGMVTGRDKV